MHDKFIALICTSLVLLINAQNDDPSRIPMGRYDLLNK